MAIDGKPDPGGSTDPLPARRDDAGGGPLGWWRTTNRRPEVIAAIRRARRALPGDPNFGDPLSTAGYGGPETAARAAGRLLGERGAASREVSLAGLQLWQAVAERVTRRPVNDEVTLVFTDLVGFSSWALRAGDDAALRLLRSVAQTVEPPLLDAGGRVVKRMGDGLMAVFDDPLTAVRSVSVARAALREVDVDGYQPRMRVGIHTGRPQRIGSDWLGIDVNIAARVMESATKGGVVVTGATRDRLTDDDMAALGVAPRRLRRPMFGARPAGLPVDIAIYRLERRRGGGHGVDGGSAAG